MKSLKKQIASQSLALIAALIIYAGFSSPTPESLGVAEILIALGLAGAVGVTPAFKTITGWPLFAGDNAAPFQRRAVIPFLYFLYVPFVLGMINQAPLNDIARDVIPLFYLFLPLLLVSSAQGKEGDTARLLLWGAAMIGVLYGFRFLVIMDMPLHKIGEERGDDGLLYLASEPCVLFAALYLPMRAFSATSTKMLHRAGLLLGGLIAAAALAATIQRAPVAFILMIWGGYGFVRCRHDIRMVLVFLVMLLAVMLTLYEPIIGLLDLIWTKTLEVGDNARLDELRAVIGALRLNAWDALWGKGWGALVLSPAAGHAWVRYTHVLWSYALLKAGIIGFAFMLYYMALLVPRGWRLMVRAPMLFFSLAPPLAMGVLLTPSFKMLGFGVLMSLLVFAERCGRIESSRGESIKA